MYFVLKAWSKREAVRHAPLGERGMGRSTRAARYGSISMKEHIETSNAEIVLIVMVEDKKAIDEIADIAAIDGLDLVAIGPSDLSQALGVSGKDEPLLKQTIEDIATTLKRVGKAKMTFPLNHTAYPLNVTELQRLGVAYCNAGPPDFQRLLGSYQEQVKEIKRQLSA